jgi:type II secretory pathway component PulC
LNEKVRKSIVFGIFIIAVIWGYSNLSQNREKTAKEPVIAKQQVVANIVNANPAENQTIAIDQNFNDSIYALYANKPIARNPFYHNRKKVSGRVQKAKIHLMGILYRQTNAQALINDKVLGVGDLISGYQIKNITKESVILEKAGKTVTLYPQKESL